MMVESLRSLRSSKAQRERESRGVSKVLKSWVITLRETLISTTGSSMHLRKMI